eukprot:955798-Prymnesium_polylepis.1
MKRPPWLPRGCRADGSAAGAACACRVDATRRRSVRAGDVVQLCAQAGPAGFGAMRPGRAALL